MEDDLYMYLETVGIAHAQETREPMFPDDERYMFGYNLELADNALQTFKDARRLIEESIPQNEEEQAALNQLKQDCSQFAAMFGLKHK